MFSLGTIGMFVLVDFNIGMIVFIKLTYIWTMKNRALALLEKLLSVITDALYSALLLFLYDEQTWL